MIHDPRELKRRSLLRLKGIESGRALIGPATVQLHLTDLCNLRCQYCYYYGPGSALLPTGKNHLPYEVFEKVTADLAALKVDTINLSGIGDPSLHPRFYDMLRHLEKDFKVTMNTNATFPIERCRDILRADGIVINLGADDRASYRELQGKDLFMRVIKNIRELARLRPKYNPNFYIEVVFVVNRLNEQSLQKTEDLVRKLGADHVQRKKFQPSDHNLHMMLPGEKQNSEIAGDWPPCYHGWFYSSIKLNGDVNVCCFMQSLKIGNVLSTSFKDIWQSPMYAQARNSALTGKEPFSSDHDCINCPAARRNKEIGAQLETYGRMAGMARKA
jgi:MoaA/NifB/PqqE/SkfB family radical SAM enzyme